MFITSIAYLDLSGPLSYWYTGGPFNPALEASMWSQLRILRCTFLFWLLNFGVGAGACGYRSLPPSSVVVVVVVFSVS